MRLNGTRLNGVRLNGAQVVGDGDVSGPMSGALFAGAELEAELSDGTTLMLVVDNVREENGLWFYSVSIPTEEGTFPLCADDAGNPVEAMPLEGRQPVPNRGAAVGSFQLATRDLAGAVAGGSLEARFGNGFMSRIAGVSRFQATKTLEDTACNVRSSYRRFMAVLYLASGDYYRYNGRFYDAQGAYKLSISMASSSGGVACQ